jgi:hypothetical protein
MKQPADAALRSSGFFRMLTRSIAGKLNDLPPRIEFAPGCDPLLQEIYCECVLNPNEDSEVSLHWTLFNGWMQVAWPEGLQVIPVLCAPSVRMFFESDICALEPQTSADLKIKLKIPKEAEHHYYTILFKIKTAENFFVGPNLIAFIKVIDMEKAKEDELHKQ